VPPDEHESDENPVPVPEPPIEQPKPPPDGVYLGIPVEDTAYGENGLWMPSKLRGRHLYLIGKTRTGKTTLIKNLIIQDMQQGHGLCSIDPHGDCAEELLANVPAERIKDVIYFDPSRTFSPSFNFFRLPFPPYKLTEDVVAVFKMFFGSAWGPRMEHLLRFSVLTLLSDEEPHTLPDLRRLCINADFRTEIAARVQDPAIREFWEHEFPTIEKGAFNPIINKLSAFLLPGSPLLRVFSEKENDLDFSAIMNGEKILIVNLAKGVLGDEPSRLLGGLIVTGIQQAALARANIPPDQRKEFHFYIDEFQNFVVDSISTILSESAKYQLFLTLAHQTLGQLPTGIERSIFGNIATLISFQISAEDAGTLRREMKGISHRFSYRGSPITLRKAIEEAKKTFEDHIAEDTAEYKKAQSENNQTRMSIYGRDKQIFEKRLATLLETTFTTPRELVDFLYTYGLHDGYAPFSLLEFPFPNPDDFINMQARHAICKMERASNVTAFTTAAPPDPVAGTRGQILNAMRERHAKRAKERPKPKLQPQPQPVPQPARQPVAKARPAPRPQPTAQPAGAQIIKFPKVKKPPQKIPNKKKITF